MSEDFLQSSVAVDHSTSGHGASTLDQARSELVASQTALAESIEATAFLKNVLDSSRDCIKVLTLAGDIVFMNEGGKTVMDVDDFEAIRGCPWTDFWQGADKLSAQAALNAARAGGTGNFQGAAPTAKGRPKHWDVTVTRILGRHGHADHILSISRDITDAREMADQKDLISREMGHRIKNSLAVVQAIALQTFRGADRQSLADFNARLASLGAAQALLLQASWERASVRELILQTLAPMCPPDRLNLEGMDFEINGRGALALALALHELGTNAVKYGALSNDRGSVAIILGSDEGHFKLTWQETGGPRVVAPTHTGFGTRLMTRNLESDLCATVELNFDADGVVLSLTAPH